jgi:hypothetical protein
VASSEAAAFRRALVRVANVTVLGVLPAALLAAFLAVALPIRAGYMHAVDFHTFWHATRVYLHRGNPYPRVAEVSKWTRQTQRSFVYPAPVLAVLAPFGLMPYSVAVAIFAPLLAAAVAAALWLFGVRDWRCFGAAFASPAVLTSISVGTISPLLLLGLAILWRWRSRTALSAVAAAALLLAKLFLWPLAVWLWFTGRRRAAVAAIAGSLLATAMAWTWNGFAGLGGYLRVLDRLSLTEGPHGYSPLWWVNHSPSVFVVAGVIAMAGVAYVARREREGTSFSIAVAAALLLSPILWLHYLALLPAIVAVHKPRLSLGWLCPLALWLTPQQGSYGEPWRTGLVVGVLLLVGITATPVLSRARAGLEAATS